MQPNLPYPSLAKRYPNVVWAWQANTYDITKRAIDYIKILERSGVIPTDVTELLRDQKIAFGFLENGNAQTTFRFGLSGFSFTKPGSMIAFMAYGPDEAGGGPVPQAVVLPDPFSPNLYSHHESTAVHEAQHINDHLCAQKAGVYAKTLADRILFSRFLEGNARTAELLYALRQQQIHGHTAYLDRFKKEYPEIYQAFRDALAKEKLLHTDGTPACKIPSEIPATALRTATLAYFTTKKCSVYDLSFLYTARSHDARQAVLTLTPQAICAAININGVHYFTDSAAFDLKDPAICGPAITLLNNTTLRHAMNKELRAELKSLESAKTTAAADMRDKITEAFVDKAKNIVRRFYDRATNEPVPLLALPAPHQANSGNAPRTT